MSEIAIKQVLTYVIGFTAQILFSARIIVQWIKSEKAGKVLTPEIFWKLSLSASFLMFIYGRMRDDFAIMLGQTLTYFIYIRNMQLQGSWKRLSLYLRYFLLSFPFIIIVYFYFNGKMDLHILFRNENIPMQLLIWGSFGQVIFILRFVYQWLHSEYEKVSGLPFGFWLLSLIGSSIILSYAVYRRDIVLFIGQMFGFTVYLRNIIIGWREKYEN